MMNESHMDDEASLVGAGWTDLGALQGKPSSPSSSAAVASASIPSQEALAHEALFQIDVLQKIFCWLPHAVDLASATLVNRTWRDALREDQYWRAVYVRQYGTPHPWEACSSYREQCARRVGLRWPRPAPPLPGPPAPGTSIETYDKLYGIRTLAVLYDSVSRALVRAVHSRALVGDDVRVVVQGISLGPSPPAAAADSPAGGGSAAGNDTAPRTGTNVREVVRENLDTGLDTDADPIARDGPLRGVVPPAAGSNGGAAAAATAVASSSPWICMLSLDGRPPKPPPPSPAADGHDGADDAGAAADAARNGEKYMTEEYIRQLASLEQLLPTVMCSGGGLLYLPAGPTGRGLVLWDLAAAAVLPPPSNAPPPALPSPPPQPREPYWLVSEAHPGRLLAAAADGSLAVSGCDGGRLCFWNGRQRLALGQANISDLTQLPVLDMFPSQTAPASERRHRLRIAVCEASAIAAVLLTSPLSPTVYIYRAAPRQWRQRHRCSSADSDTVTDFCADPNAGVGQLLAAQTFGGAPCSGLLLFRGHMLIMQVMCSDVYGARFGGSGGSSVLVTVMVCLWELPGDEDEEGEEEQGGVGDAATAVAAGGGYSSGGGGHWSDSWQRLFSSRLQLEHPRTLVLGRMRPVLAASEDLMLLTAPRNVGSRPPHSRVLALELPPRWTHGSSDEEEEEEEEEEGEEEEEEEGE
ncbi:hypothetical protein VaNZ11_006831, partial [Volvox africanus]